MFVIQVSVFLENKPGALREMTALLGADNIDVRELSVADTASFGIVRMIIRSEQTETCINVLRGAGYTARSNHVICAEIDDKPNGLCNLLSIIENEGLSIEYMYSFRRTAGGHVLMVMRFSDQESALNILNAYGVRLYSQAEVDAL